LDKGKVKSVIVSDYPIVPMIILLACFFGTLFGCSNNIDTARAIEQMQLQQQTQVQQQQEQQQKGTGTIDGGGTSEVTGGVCSSFHNNDFLTIKFDASFLLSSDGKTGQVTSGSGILKTTYSKVFGYLSITGGTINIGVKPALYSLKGTATFQSPSFSSSSCNLPSAVKFSIAKSDGTQLKCGNTDLITFNSIPLIGSITGNVDCTHTTLVSVVGSTPTPPQNVKSHTTPPDNVKIISAVGDHGIRISNGAVNIPSKSISFHLSRPTDNVGVASLQCNIDGSTVACPSSGSLTSYNNLNPGSHSFTFMAKDSAGNTSSDRFTWTISANAKDYPVK
jgi:hypothetical protein